MHRGPCFCQTAEVLPLAPRTAPFVLLALLGSLGLTACERPLSPEEDRQQALALVHARASPAEKDGCPADVMPAREHDVEALEEHCEKRLTWCAKRCFSDDPAACFSLALVTQRDELDDAAAELLFYRACALGVSSGCTNRAAGMMAYAGEQKDKIAACTARTFQKSCERLDPWGCTMHAANLINGSHVERDLAKAREALERSCRFGPEDPACQYAQGLKAQLEERLEDK